MELSCTTESELSAYCVDAVDLLIVNLIVFGAVGTNAALFIVSKENRADTWNGLVIICITVIGFLGIVSGYLTDYVMNCSDCMPLIETIGSGTAMAVQYNVYTTIGIWIAVAVIFTSAIFCIISQRFGVCPRSLSSSSRNISCRSKQASSRNRIQKQTSTARPGAKHVVRSPGFRYPEIDIPSLPSESVILIIDSVNDRSDEDDSSVVTI